jgi:hypothetical protein
VTATRALVTLTSLALAASCGDDGVAAGDGQDGGDGASCQRDEGSASVIGVVVEEDCLFRYTPVFSDYTTPCALVEATDADPCICEDGKTPLPRGTCESFNASLVGSGHAGKSCFCVVEQATGDSMRSCQLGDGEPWTGWCVVTRECVPSDHLFTMCPDDTTVLLRIAEASRAPGDSQHLLSCVGIDSNYPDGGRCPPSL